MDAIYHVLNPWWEGRRFDSGIRRGLYADEIMGRFGRKQVEVIVGSRRVGKTTLVKQLIQGLLDSGIPPEEILYLQLDHPQLSGTVLTEHLRGFREHFMHDRGGRLYLFLDEVQASPKWETHVKALYDTENVKMVCTGSTASLIKSQGGQLTGRQITTTVHPLNFSEYLDFKGVKPSPTEDYKYERYAEDYLREGGYPENVLQPSVEYMRNLLDDILVKDLIQLRSLRKPWMVKDLVHLLAASVGSRISYNKIAKTLGTTVDTVKEYVGHLESAFLVKTLNKYSASHTERVYSPKKIYLNDTGLKTLMTGEGDLGAKAENAVYLKLQGTSDKIGYYAESEREVDFVCGRNNPTPVEVKYASDFDWGDRKYAGLKLYLRRHPKTKQAHIITKNAEKKIKENRTDVTATPLWRYLLQ